MKVEDIVNKLNSTEYKFLREEKSLGNNIILLTTGGSHAYGTDVETSDLDIRGIALNSKKELLTMKCKDKPFENRDNEKDVTIYFLKQIINLLTNANPNVLEILGTKEDHLFICTKEGRMLKDNANMFLSKRAYVSFGGYAIQQLRRLQNALARDSYPQVEKEKHILGSIEKQMMTFTDRYKKVINGELKLYIDKSSRQGFENEIFIDISLKKYPLRDLKGMYSEMNQVVNDYYKLNHRNSKKDELHLNKHAMHLIRLLVTGTEILEGKGINTYREKERELLLDIRSSKYTYEQIFEMVDTYDKQFEYAKKNCNLPDTPNYKKIDELVIEINKGVVVNGED
ncbi:DNA polymerase beta superfamily protein [Clostridium magnum]|uniref:Putative nucleotidyltransferase n=1 Tax=Clostridium magnum DSM 2767 TaxID=1121326 RepID=A0A161YP13_9CLOT|nr:nucleotidyltransferase domain-containing protein [Clostridium magnum]KZL92482.1 putative nucleotidyltransferase [Clostridium magnum DSM 2767]SHI26410.1 Predicted nucleotidyltransferase [Clostridium magnum DSM 2767]